MKIDNVRVYGLEESLVASGYPFKISNDHFENDVEMLKSESYVHKEELNADFKRGCNLGNNPIGNGESNYLKGIAVHFDLEFSIKAWYDVERYKFLDFVSSMSTMHSITKFDIKKQCNSYVWPETIEKLERKLETYKKLLKNRQEYLVNGSTEAFNTVRENMFLEIIYNVPVGFQFTARMSSNYMCLKNIYYQRRYHRLLDFKMMCNWIETLPYFKELCLKNK